MKKFFAILILIAFVVCGAVSICAAGESTEPTTVQRTFRREPLPPSEEVQKMRNEIKVFSLLEKIAQPLVLAAGAWVIVACVKNRKLKKEIRNLRLATYGYAKELMPGTLVISLGIVVAELCATVLVAANCFTGLANQAEPLSVLVSFLLTVWILVLLYGFLSLVGFILALAGLRSEAYRGTAILLSIWHGAQMFPFFAILAKQ